MRVKDYEFMESADDYEISDERKAELIRKVKSKISKKNTIALFKVLEIGKNDEEYNFIYNWLDENDIDVRGTSGSLSGEIQNYERIRRYGQSIREDEVELEEQTDYFKRMEKGKKEGATIDEIRDGKKARSEFIAKNMKLADWIANWSMFRQFNYSAEELQSFAYQGLIRSVDRFKYDKKYIDSEGNLRPHAFSTYATKSIVRTIFREIYRESPVPIYLMSQMQELDKVIMEYQIVSEGETPSVEDLASILGVSPINIIKIQKAKEYYELNGKLLNSLDEYIENPIDEEKIVDSIDDSGQTEIIGSGKTILGFYKPEKRKVYSESGYIVDGIYVDLEEPSDENLIEDGETEVLNTADLNNLQKNLLKTLKKLSKREQYVLLARTGMLTGKEMTLEEVRIPLKVNRERVRQIEAKAIIKLRIRDNYRAYEDFINSTSYEFQDRKPILPPNTKTSELFIEFLQHEEKIDHIQEKIEDVLKSLTPKERFIIEANIGMLTGNCIPKNILAELFNENLYFFNKDLQLAYKKVALEIEKQKETPKLMYYIKEGSNMSYIRKFKSPVKNENLFTEFIKMEMRENSKKQNSEQQSSEMPEEILTLIAEIQSLKERGESKQEIVKLYAKLNEMLDRELAKDKDEQGGPDFDEE